MTFNEYKAKNPGISEDGLIEDLEQMCELGEGAEDFCEALDDYYSQGLSKENMLRPVVITARKAAKMAGKKPNYTAAIIIGIIVLVTIVWYFKFYKK